MPESIDFSTLSKEEKSLVILNLITDLLLTTHIPFQRAHEVSVALDFVDDLKRSLQGIK
jgi:hypothetical protein